MTDKAEPTTLAKAAALHFRGRGRFFAVKESDEAITGAFGIEEAPAVVVLRADGTTEAYDGPTKARASTTPLRRLSPSSAQPPNLLDSDPALTLICPTQALPLSDWLDEQLPAPAPAYTHPADAAFEAAHAEAMEVGKDKVAAAEERVRCRVPTGCIMGAPLGAPLGTLRVLFGCSLGALWVPSRT